MNTIGWTNSIRRRSVFFSSQKQKRNRFFGAVTKKNYSSGGSNVNNKIDEIEFLESHDYAHPSYDLPSYNSHYIGGKWTSHLFGEGGSDRSIDVIDPCTGQKVSSVPRGSENDTIKAINAAKDALPSWRTVPITKRLALLQALLSRFEAKRDDVVERTMAELGCTKRFAKNVQYGSFVSHLKTLLRLFDSSSFEWEYAAGKCTVVKEPVGVVGAITPWNYPLNQIVVKMAPALLAGCTVVLKPSEVTPLVAYSVAEAFDEAASDVDGIPEGIFNMVMGYGQECGQILASHDNVDLVSFTGSTRAGQMLTEVASKTMTPVVAELGGKSAAILLDDADYDSVVPKFVEQLMENTGQSCNALSRMIVPRKDYDVVIDIAKNAFQKEVIGIPNNPNATMGPLVSKDQYDRVQAFLDKGIEEGANVVVGGPGRPTDSTLPEHGYFVQPTLFADVSNDMSIAREEIFGPVLSVIPYDNEEEAVSIANDTIYGLNNAVASNDLTRALDVSSQLESGMVMVNSTFLDTRAPFGGYKMSGRGREWGIAGLEEFLVTKMINIPVHTYRAARTKTIGGSRMSTAANGSMRKMSTFHHTRRVFTTITPSVEPVLDKHNLGERLLNLPLKQVAQQLSENGFYTTTGFLLPGETQAMRQQAIALKDEGRYEQSWSESIDEHGVARRFDKEGVFACEPDGADYETAPDLLIWMSWLLQTLPTQLNSQMSSNGDGSVSLSNQAFNAKLAVTKPGGSTYPLHIDNPQGLAVNDTRKLTAIIYLNPDYEEGDGGHLRIYLKDNVITDLAPTGGRLLLFWSDLIPHEVLPTSPDRDQDDETKDRYALTLWIPTTDQLQIHPPTSKFSELRNLVTF